MDRSEECASALAKIFTLPGRWCQAASAQQTILTDYYEETGDIKLVQQLAGHTTSAMTLEHYVRGRKDVSQATSAIERIYAQNVSQHGEIRKKSAEPQSPEA